MAPPQRAKLRGQRSNLDAATLAAAVALAQRDPPPEEEGNGHVPDQSSSRKRSTEPEADGGKTADGKQEGTMRGSLPAKAELIARMRADPQFAPVDRDEAERLRQEFQRKIVIMDQTTGEEREVDVSLPEDVDYLAREQNTDVLARTEGTTGAPKDLSTGMMCLSRAMLPKDLNETGVLPLRAFELKKYMRDNANSLSDILLWLPLINIPVFTPKLQMLLMLDTPTWPTQDSFQQLRTYIAVLHIIYRSETVSKCRDAALNWLSDRVEARTVTRDDIELVMANAVFKDDIVYEEDEGGEVEKRVERLRWEPMAKFDESQLTVDDIDSLHEHILTVVKYEGAAWAPEGRVFGEDVMAEHIKAGQLLCEDVGIQLDQVVNEHDTVTMFSIVRNYTLRFLRLYEASIMRLLSQASLIGDTIPQKYFGGLCSPEKLTPDADDVHVTVRKTVRAAREEISQARAEAMCRAAPAPATIVENRAGYEGCNVAKSLIHDVEPSHEELVSYFAFVNFYAQDEHDLVEVMERLQKSMHIVEPAEVVEGMSVPNVEVEDGDDVMG